MKLVWAGLDPPKVEAFVWKTVRNRLLTKDALSKGGCAQPMSLLCPFRNKYEKQGEELIADLLATCNKCAQEFGPIDVVSQLQVKVSGCSHETVVMNGDKSPKIVKFKIGDEKIVCDRQKITSLSAPFHAMLNGYFTKSLFEDIDIYENNISPLGMRTIGEFSITGSLSRVHPDLLLEILVFANKFCCEGLKDACDRKLASLACTKDDAVEFMEYAIEQNSPILAASCLQVFLHDLPDCLNDDRMVEIFSHADRQQRSIMLGCVRLLRKEYDEAESLFKGTVSLGHVYSIASLARLNYTKGHKLWSYEKLCSVISSVNPPQWMYQERSLYCEGDMRWKDLEKAIELDPTLTYPYRYRAASLMMKQNVEAALVEINRVLGFKLALECLELRFCLYLAIEDSKAAIRDVQAILTLFPDYRMFEGRVAASQLRTHVGNWTTTYCWMQLYDGWSSVDDIRSLSVIYQMLESGGAKEQRCFILQTIITSPQFGFMYHAYMTCKNLCLYLIRLNCPDASMRSLELAYEHASSEHERLVYEGWILYDIGHCEEGLRKAEESIKISRSFEAFFLKAYALADSSLVLSCSSTIISLLENALKCPSDNLRKGQALNNLGSVFIDCGKLDSTTDCYINALKIRHTRAHQGLARVHFLKNDKAAAYVEMSKLIEKAKNNAFAYEKRSEYCDRDLTKADLEMVTRLDPLRVYPYQGLVILRSKIRMPWS
ncbi:hypothetical protein V6N13_071495 [Hibiscus sabdariffa]